jgi:hypothetical protein
VLGIDRAAGMSARRGGLSLQQFLELVEVGGHGVPDTWHGDSSKQAARTTELELVIIDLLQAAHLRRKAEGGSDHPRNGLVLCALHHLAYDRGLWAIEPSSLEVRFFPAVRMRCSCALPVDRSGIYLANPTKKPSDMRGPHGRVHRMRACLRHRSAMRAKASLVSVERSGR